VNIFTLYIYIIYPIIEIVKGNFQILKRGEIMIIFDKLWETKKKKGISKYKLREKYLIENRTLMRLKANENMETKTLDKLCEILDCNLEDIATYVKIEKDE
jgi:DNA-binding Xre family transcriptional regulator